MTEKRHIVAFAILCAVGFSAAAGTQDRTCAEPAVIFDGSGNMSEPKIVSKVDPKYPEEARKEGASGAVVLDAVIDSEGGVVEVNVLEDPDPRLSAAAAEAVLQWRFDPALDKNGDPIAVCYVLTVKFHLK